MGVSWIFALTSEHAIPNIIFGRDEYYIRNIRSDISWATIRTNVSRVKIVVLISFSNSLEHVKKWNNRK